MGAWGPKSVNLGVHSMKKFENHWLSHNYTMQVHTVCVSTVVQCSKLWLCVLNLFAFSLSQVTFVAALNSSSCIAVPFSHLSSKHHSTKQGKGHMNWHADQQPIMAILALSLQIFKRKQSLSLIHSDLNLILKFVSWTPTVFLKMFVSINGF